MEIKCTICCSGICDSSTDNISCHKSPPDFNLKSRAIFTLIFNSFPIQCSPSPWRNCIKWTTTHTTGNQRARERATTIIIQVTVCAQHVPHFPFTSCFPLLWNWKTANWNAQTPSENIVISETHSTMENIANTIADKTIYRSCLSFERI